MAFFALCVLMFQHVNGGKLFGLNYLLFAANFISVIFLKCLHDVGCHYHAPIITDRKNALFYLLLEGFKDFH